MKNSNLTVRQFGLQIQFDAAQISFVADKKRTDYEIEFQSEDLGNPILNLLYISNNGKTLDLYGVLSIKTKAESVKVMGFGLNSSNAIFLN